MNTKQQYTQKVISGGQTGVDRAALDVAMKLGFATGGWCPAGRKAVDGRIPDHYNLTETKSKNYRVRTGWNIRDSDATMVLYTGNLEGGTALTIKLAKDKNKPWIALDLKHEVNQNEALNWLRAVQPTTLNIAGPREESRPGIHRQADIFLTDVLKKT